MPDRVFLGVDTSNYTTSVAVLDGEGRLLANIKRPLPVKEGERGLRQSDAVFYHVRNLPSAMEEAGQYLSGKRLAAVAVSDRPRNTDGSYMPCFLSGVSAAESIRAATGCPLYRFSHQCGHIMAAVYGSGREDLIDRTFAAFHVSGGTTELVRVSPCDVGFSTELLGGTKDLNAGQIIDRVGVRMGLRFPAGPEMEKLALENRAPIPKRHIPADRLSVNLSGVENLSVGLFEKTGDRALTAAFTLAMIGDALSSLAAGYEERFGKSEFLFAGGVMSNSILKETLAQRFSAAFAPPSLSADNAVGTARLGYRAWLSQRKEENDARS